MGTVEQTQEIQGFLLTQNRRDVRGRCKIFLTGCSAQGPFEAEVDERPVFFVKHGLELPRDVGFLERRALELRDFDFNPVDVLYFSSLASMRAGRERVREIGAYTYEGDLDPADRFLMERFINGGVTVKGPFRMDEGVRVFRNPRVTRSQVTPQVSLMSLDLETTAEGEILSAAYQYKTAAGQAVSRVYVVSEGVDCDGVYFCATEKALLLVLMRDVNTLDPDLIIGWNILGFDFPVIVRRCEVNGVAPVFGRRGRLVGLFERNGRSWVELHGRVVVDGIPALRSAFYNFENFKLDTVAHELLGEGKLIGEQGTQKVEEIWRLYREDVMRFAAYNLQDCRLVTEIFEKTSLVALMERRTQISGMLFYRQGRSVGAFDHFYLPRLHRRGFVAPDVDDIRVDRQAIGGLILPPKPGLHEHVVVLDYTSLYPSIIRTFKIDPLARILDDRDPVATPGGGRFSASEHVLPDFIEKLMVQRAEAKRSGNRALAQAIKILMNSFYGVMGTKGCRFYHDELPSNITESGQWILRKTESLLAGLGYVVLYGDTDSVFVRLKEEDQKNPFDAANAIILSVNGALSALLKKDFGVDSCLDLAVEKYYRRLYLPEARHGGGGGAAKRYVGQKINQQGEETLEFKGIEAVRTDWTPLARECQRELFKRLFHGEEICQWVTRLIKEVRAGTHDEALGYHKRIRRALASYDKATPPHIRAARQLPESAQKKIREISYVMTLRGPVPLSLPHPDIDHEHYIEKQIRPIVEPVLELIGREFEACSGDGVQLKLF